MVEVTCTTFVFVVCVVCVVCLVFVVCDVVSSASVRGRRMVVDGRCAHRRCAALWLLSMLDCFVQRKMVWLGEEE